MEEAWWRRWRDKTKCSRMLQGCITPVRPTGMGENWGPFSTGSLESRLILWT